MGFGCLHYVFRFLLRILMHVFFQKIEVIGLENVPKEGPIVFTGNHPNGLIDPFMLFSFSPRSIHIMAKDTLFRIFCFGSIIKAAGGIPVRRRQDHGGADNVDNTSVFESVFATLASGECFGIFPEGISHDKSSSLFSQLLSAQFLSL
eukprot:TRINITY_DN1063_c0_g1_i1.p1 TRINITY_DN1063_c0_g1~~TRINITY_DN1063_c0_g1_i1.p1  ORF type:complete len:148 (-),score=36.58 TRINITY_DN1063_c0_g1_i1:69-512(-)